MNDLTPWYPISIKPVRCGWYDYDGYLIDERMYWNGQQWGYWIGSGWVHLAEDATDEWRGHTGEWSER